MTFDEWWIERQISEELTFPDATDVKAAWNHQQARIDAHNKRCDEACKTTECDSEWGHRSDADWCAECPMHYRIEEDTTNE